MADGAGIADAAPGGTGARPNAPRLLEYPTIQALQRRHFILLDVLPFLGCLAAFPILAWTGVTAADWLACLLMWFLTVVGIEIGYHRYFSHNAFKTSETMKGILVVLASLGGQGPVISWAATHRHHHEFSDKPEDSHSPLRYGHGLAARLKGFFFSQVFWKWSYPFPNPTLYAKGMLADPVVNGLSRHYFPMVLAGLLLPALLGWLARGDLKGFLAGFFLGGVVRLFACQQGTFLINSAGHLFGSRPYGKRDGSRNNYLFILPSLGGSLHNNHHAFPFSASNALHGWQPDPAYWVIALWEKCNLVWDVRTVSPGMRDRAAAS